MSSDIDTAGVEEPEPENLYEVTVNVEYTETFDHESESKERSEEFGEHLVGEDIAQGDIPVDAMDISAEAVEVN